MTGKKILVMYKSVTGFTREYAEIIARKLDCPLMELKGATAKTLSGFDTVIFGGRLHAGTVDGLKNAKELFKQSRAAEFIVYATGAMTDETENTSIINEMWSKNLTPAELRDIPHFYMPGGLRYDKMPLPDKMMMKAFCAMLKKKKDKSGYEKQMEKAVSGSYDISSEAYIMPLVTLLLN